MKSKVVSLENAIGRIKDGSVVAIGGFIGSGHPEAITEEIEKSYLESGAPNNLTLIYAAGQGDGKDKGLNHLGHKGLVSRVIGGSWGLVPKLQKLAINNGIKAYNIPQGVISHMYRDIAAGKPGTITHIGLKTFVNPRISGGKLNEVTTEEIIKVINVDGKEYLFYKSIPIDVSIIRATYSSELKVQITSIEVLPLDERKVIARRAAMELKKNSIINLGIGMPEGISIVANEEGVGDEVILTVEAGAIGGVPANGLNFGASLNPISILYQSSQFDFYDGGGLDAAFLGLAQCDKNGNINVSKFGPKIPGCGGFINITQNAKKVVYCGTFTAGGLKVEIKDRKINIITEGKFNKFVNEVEQITFSGEYVGIIGQEVLALEEIAPGVDLEKDILAHMDFKPIISDNLKIMDDRIFVDDLMGLELIN